MLFASIAISAVLTGIFAHRMLRIAKAWRSAASGARLHLRFVTLFALAALAPAIIVAAFLGFTFSQGVDRWFSQRVESTIENAADVGRAYVDLASGGLSSEVEAMGVDLNAARQGLVDEPQRYLAFLNAQTERRALSAAYVVDSAGRVLARSEMPGAGPYRPPSRNAYVTANANQVSVRFDEPTNSVRALYRLNAYQDAYLLVARPVAPWRIIATPANNRARCAVYLGWPTFRRRCWCCWPPVGWV
jgi:two-component system nitrogen regulation sensor histidine kinase NtrY